MKVWMVATYKTNELKRLKENLTNQNLEHYLPRIFIKKNNLPLVEELLFPGYIFVYACKNSYQKIRFTKGIKKVISFNKNIAILEEYEIAELKKIEEESISKPVSQKISVGQEAILSDGPLKGSFITIASLPHKDRVNILIHILGKKRKITVPLIEIEL